MWLLPGLAPLLMCLKALNSQLTLSNPFVCLFVRFTWRKKNMMYGNMLWKTRHFSLNISIIINIVLKESLAIYLSLQNKQGYQILNYISVARIYKMKHVPMKLRYDIRHFGHWGRGGRMKRVCNFEELICISETSDFSSPLQSKEQSTLLTKILCLTKF